MWITILTRIPYLSVLVDHAYELVSDVEDVSPVKVGHALLPVLVRTVVQEVEDLLDGKLRLCQTVVHEVKHCGVSYGVLETDIYRYCTVYSKSKSLETYMTSYYDDHQIVKILHFFFCG